MNLDADLREHTKKYFDCVNFSELSDRWIEGVIDNEFTDAEENDITVSILFVGEPNQILYKLADICSAWCRKQHNYESREFNDADASVADEVLWTVLDELDINIKHIQALTYLLCHRSVKNDSSVEDKFLGLACAKLYFTCLKLPGSATYSMFHPNLFNLCIDCLPVPDCTSEKESRSLVEFRKLSSVYVPALIALIPVLREFHFGDDSNSLEHVIKKLSELSACEVQSYIDFDVNFLEISERELKRKYKPTYIVTALAYQALSSILDTDLNGDKDYNYSIILAHLNKHILCYKARKNQSVSNKHLMVKNNAVNFILHNLKTKDFCLKVTEIAIKRLSLAVPDKTEIRGIVALAILKILFQMEAERVAEMMDWFLLFIDSADVKDRVFALEVMGQMLNSTDDANAGDASTSIVNGDDANTNTVSNADNASSIPISLKHDSVRIPMIFAVLTRCDDVSPVVRTKALTVLSQNMKCILNFLDRTKDQTTFKIDDSVDVNEKDLDVNGVHRFFWYNLPSFRERLNEIAAILQRRIDDNNVTARKAALLALENLIIFDKTYVTEENLKFFDSAARDGNIVVKKQMIKCLSEILDAYKENLEVQESWLKCILPLIHDPEASVQSKALSTLEDIFLVNIFSKVEADRAGSFALLKLVSSNDFLCHQKYLQKSFKLWKSENKLHTKSLNLLEGYISTEWEECVWFYISKFSMYSSVPSTMSNLCIKQFEKLESSGVHPHFTEYIIKIIMHIHKELSLEKIQIVQGVICDSLKSFSVPVELIPLYIEVLFHLFKHCNAETEFASFSSSVVEICEKHLNEFKSAGSVPTSVKEDVLARYFCSIQMFCHFCSSNVTPTIVSLLQHFCAFDIDKPSKSLTPTVRAHAFVALGKICLQDEILAKDVIPKFAKVLYMITKYDVIRNNTVMILTEMCKRYTSLADKYLPSICSHFKDKLFLIRYQAVVLVTNLLQEGYIKWRGPLFFCMLSTLLDKKEVIQELGRYSLSQLLQDKKKNLFTEHFIQSIYVFNQFSPPDNLALAQSVKDLAQFSLTGEDRRSERMFLYRYLLESMGIQEKACLVNSICEILTSIADSVYKFNNVTEGIVRDCFAILTCQEIRSLSLDQLEDIDEATENEFCKTELSTRRVIIIDPTIPVVVNLRNSITDPQSDLINDIILFLKELLHDFRDSLKDILAIDKVLLRQLELELKNDAEKERACKRNKQSSAEKEQNPPVTLEGIQTLIKDVSHMMGQDKESDDAPNEDSTPPSEQTPRASPISKHVRQLHRSNYKALPSTSRASSNSNDQQQTYNVASSSPAEAADIQRFASTPRVLLTAVKVPLTTNILNISAIEPATEPMIIDDSDEDM